MTSNTLSNAPHQPRPRFYIDEKPVGRASAACGCYASDPGVTSLLRPIYFPKMRTLDRKLTAASKIYLVADNYRIHKAKAVEEWLQNHPRFELVWLPAYCPKANPIERSFGDVHDKCTRNHKRTRIADLVDDVRWHLKRNGPWQYQLSSIYYTPELDAAVAELLAAENLKAA